MHGIETWRVGGSGAERSAQWQQIVSKTHLPWTVSVPRHEADDYRGQMRRQWIDDLAAVDCECEPCAGRRGRQQIENTEGEYISVMNTLAGRQLVEQGG